MRRSTERSLTTSTRTQWVQVGLRRKMTDGTCRWWDGDSWVQRRCALFLWRRANGTESWIYDVLGNLPRSVGTRTVNYTLFSRAKDYANSIESSFQGGRNRVAFEVE